MTNELNLCQSKLIDVCKVADAKLMYAEELCFAPKYERLKALLDDGALGEPVLFKQSEKHDGPNSDHFWDIESSGGGVTMDMGCHAIQFFRCLHPKKNIKLVYAQIMTRVHQDKTEGEDNSIIILKLEDVVTAIMEESWTKLGDMDDKVEVHGSEGVAYADILQGNSIQTYSNKGVDYAVEKIGNTIGWGYTMFEGSWNHGFPQEFKHLMDCVKNDKQPLVTGVDGKTVQKLILAAYESTETGKKVLLPFKSDVDIPYKLVEESIVVTFQLF
ncbi:Gfo/Idh/MocA family protein [Flagellimonas iocasae]|uniref:Gfo/Idh/MocA family protein n=1 Tax=Flagellimonas iocasae TaxID=2055905 RepID=A0ABW4Y2E2_9FLAO